MLFPSRVKALVQQASVRVMRGETEIARAAFGQPPKSRMPYYHACGVFLSAPTVLADLATNYFDQARLQIFTPGGWIGVSVSEYIPNGGLVIARPSSARKNKFENGVSLPTGKYEPTEGNQLSEKRFLAQPLTIRSQPVESSIRVYAQDEGGKFYSGHLEPLSTIEPHLLQCSIEAELLPGTPIVNVGGELLAVYHGRETIGGDEVDIALCTFTGLPDQTKPMKANLPYHKTVMLDQAK